MALRFRSPDMPPFGWDDETWKEQAACRGSDVSVFYPDGKNPYDKAREICRRCPVRTACLDYARRTGERQSGMFGGLSPEERHMRGHNHTKYTYETFNGPCRNCQLWCWCPTPHVHLCITCQARQANRIKSQTHRDKGKANA